MGYDMKWRRVDDDEAQSVSALQAQILDAEISQDHRAELWRKLDGMERSYFQLNIWGMGRYRKAMFEVGMAHDAMPRPEWPEPQYDTTAARAATVGHLAGIPVHKLCSNDGWIVTPVEALSAVRIWEEAGSPMLSALVEGDSDDEYWLAWIEFLRGASEHDGFEVW